MQFLTTTHSPVFKRLGKCLQEGLLEFIPCKMYMLTYVPQVYIGCRVLCMSAIHHAVVHNCYL